MPENKLDTLRPIATPEGTQIALRVAGPVPRALAWALDALIRVVGYLLLIFALSPFGDVGAAIWLLFLFVGEWWYGVLFEVLGSGATPGKRVLGLRVVHVDGTPVGWGASVIRNFMLFVDFLPPPFGAGLVSCLVSRDFQRLGDLAAGTFVVHRAAARSTPPTRTHTALAPPVPLAGPEQAALVEFAQRVGSWTPARRAELADLLEPLTSAHGESGVERLTSMAEWVEGRV